ncbi:guanine nucleotide-binding protein-like 3 homolog [Centruroides sculpturatus]|uniref:guanine nucleotide-binding protein-like 3 homolog n=1 Tax=Centruroides sculpturatus TaxID=218467 RepID=UPI000C6E1EA4|nr:guanine nucleotide-binding protein-like 3 homolog [Centruroides sculpturatus]
MAKFHKKQSKRMTCRRKYKIQRKVREHNRKMKKEARKKKNRGKKKDPGIPNSLPFKEKILQEIEEHKKNKEINKIEKMDSSTTKTLIDLQDDAMKRSEDYANMVNLQNISKESEIEKSDMEKIQRDHKFYKEFYQVVESADVILHVLDARDPLNTRCSQVEKAVINSGTNKKLILILNKIDLIPRDNLLQWLKYLRNELPTVAFKASTQDQNDNLSQIKSDALRCSSRALHSSKCIGANMLMKLLQNYCHDKGITSSIKVGVVGFPNVGKSSIINSLKRCKACNVGAVPGITRVAEEVQLTKLIRLIDSPGIVHEKNEKSDLSYATIAKVEDLKDPESIVSSIIQRISTDQLMLQYKLPEISSPQEFLYTLSKRLGRFKKGGVPDTEMAARKFLNDWNKGKIKYFTHPPIDRERPSYISAEIVAEMGKDFNLTLLETEENELNDLVVVTPNEALEVKSKEEKMDDDNHQISLFIDEKKNQENISNNNTQKISQDDDDVKKLLAGKCLNKMRKKELKRLKKKRKRAEKAANKLADSLDAALSSLGD